MGRAAAEKAGTGWRLAVPESAGRAYHNAQIDDYAPHVRGGRYTFAHTPPVVITLRAWAEAPHGLHGTAGFGFWNHPFSPDAARLRLPRAAWFFFGSPPNAMHLAHGQPGHGWKAAVIDCTRPRAWLLVPLAPLAVPVFRTRAGFDRFYPAVQRCLGIAEQPLDTALLSEPHTYQIAWLPGRVTFRIDGVSVLDTPLSPRGPCGFVAWLDNQYAIVTPQGRFGFGLVASPAAALHLDAVHFAHA